MRRGFKRFRGFRTRFRRKMSRSGSKHLFRATHHLRRAHRLLSRSGRRL